MGHDKETLFAEVDCLLDYVLEMPIKDYLAFMGQGKYNNKYTKEKDGKYAPHKRSLAFISGKEYRGQVEDLIECDKKAKTYGAPEYVFNGTLEKKLKPYP